MQILNTLPQTVYGHASIAYNGYILVFGGIGSVSNSTVYSAPVKADGTIGNWATLTALPAVTFDSQASQHNGYVYITGGFTTGNVALSTMYSAQIKSDGTIGNWATLNTLPAITARPFSIAMP